MPPEPDFKALEAEGFPKRVSKAFQKTADELNCVVLSRVPGAPTTTLIDEGYNLKPFYIHGKSCNWGPMAGFVCQLPALNKAGTKKMAYNLKEHLESLQWFRAKHIEFMKYFRNDLIKGGTSEETEILEVLNNLLVQVADTEIANVIRSPSIAIR